MSGVAASKEAQAGGPFQAARARRLIVEMTDVLTQAARTHRQLEETRKKHVMLRSAVITLCSRMRGVVDGLALIAKDGELPDSFKALAEATGRELLALGIDIANEPSAELGGLDSVAVSLEAPCRLLESFRSLYLDREDGDPSNLETSAERLLRISEDYALSNYPGAARCAVCERVNAFGNAECSYCGKMRCRKADCLSGCCQEASL